MVSWLAHDRYKSVILFINKVAFTYKMVIQKTYISRIVSITAASYRLLKES